MAVVPWQTLSVSPWKKSISWNGEGMALADNPNMTFQNAGRKGLNLFAVGRLPTAFRVGQALG